MPLHCPVHSSLPPRRTTTTSSDCNEDNSSEIPFDYALLILQLNKSDRSAIPKTDNEYLLHSLLFDKLNIPVDYIIELHLLECSPGDLVAYSDGSKTDNGVGASAVVYQFPDLNTPLAKAIISLPDWALVYQAEVVGLTEVPIYSAMN